MENACILISIFKTIHSCPLNKTKLKIRSSPPKVHSKLFLKSITYCIKPIVFDTSCNILDVTKNDPPSLWDLNVSHLYTHYLR